jgi:hypothetical protein
MQKANASHGTAKMDRLVRRRELPCVRHSYSLHRGRVAGGAVPMSMERKKVMKKQRRSNRKD